MQRAGLEWVYRLISEPRRLARRYLVDDLPFAVRLLVVSAAQPQSTAPRLGGPAPAGGWPSQRVSCSSKGRKWSLSPDPRVSGMADLGGRYAARTPRPRAWQPEEVEYAVVHGLGPGEEYRCPRRGCASLRIPAPAGPAAPRTGRGRSRHGAGGCGSGNQGRRHPLRLAAQRWLELERALERLGLEAPGQLVRVRRVGTLHRIADEDQQPDAGQVPAIRSAASGWNM